MLFISKPEKTAPRSSQTSGSLSASPTYWGGLRGTFHGRISKRSDERLSQRAKGMKDGFSSDLDLKRTGKSSGKQGPKPEGMIPASVRCEARRTGHVLALLHLWPQEKALEGSRSCVPTEGCLVSPLLTAEQCSTGLEPVFCFSLTPPPIAWLPWCSLLLLVTKLYLKATGSVYLGSWGLSTQRANNDPRDKDAT